jgi:HCOMODA/2-hydroxy-3-carboxy-muconic semialdehyde decarboxylase
MGCHDFRWRHDPNSDRKIGRRDWRVHMREASPAGGVTRRAFATGGALLFLGAVLGSPRRAAAQANPASAGPADPHLIEDLVAANRILADQGVLDGYGHVSARHDRDPNRYLMARSVAPALVTAGDIMEYDLDSRPVEARGRASYAERFIHGEVYKARPDVKAVVHNHSPSLIPFGVATTPLQPVYHMSAFIGQGVPVFEIRNAGGMTDMLVSAPALGQALAQALGNSPAALLRGHGVVVVGPGLPLAVGRCVYLEVNAKLQMQAMALGGKITYLDPEEVRKVEARQDYRRAWELWKRQVMTK